MKRTLLLLGAFLLSMNVVFSQAAFWSENFSSGIPAGWTNAGTGGNGNFTNVWRAVSRSGGGISRGDVLTAPSGAPFVIFDSDSLDNGGNSNNIGSGPMTGPQTAWLTTTAINCSGHPRVLLQFYEHLYSYFSNTRVIVGNGTTTDTIEVNSDYGYNFAETADPTFKQYDITAIAGNQANVTITFLWEGGLYYYWMVDDIALIDAPANDLKISRAGSFDYYSYPWNQLDSIFWYSRTTNLGTATQTNVRAQIDVRKTGNATVLFTDTTAPGVSLAPGVDSALVGVTTWAPHIGPTGTSGTFPTTSYTSIVRVFSDSTDALPFDNGDTTSFQVSDSVYAIDNGVFGGSFPIYDQGTSYEWANIFEVVNQDTVTSFTASFDPVFSSFTTTSGPVVQAKLYSLDPTSFAATPVLTSESKMLKSTNFAQFGLKPVVFKVDITSGNPVLAPGIYALSMVSTSADSAVYLSNAFKKVYGSLSGEFQNGQPSAFYSNTQFVLRMNFGHNLNTLYCSWTRNPATTPLYTYRPVTFTGSSNGSSNATYDWTVTGYQSGLYQTYNTRIFRDTFFVADDSINVCLTVTDGGNTAQSCKIVRVRENVGINDVQTVSEFNMVPNPTTGAVTISAEGVSGATTITLTNLLGETVKTFNETANGSFAKAYNLSDLSTGVYIVKIQNGSNSATKRLSLSK